MQLQRAGAAPQACNTHDLANGDKLHNYKPPSSQGTGATEGTLQS